MIFYYLLIILWKNSILNSSKYLLKNFYFTYFKIIIIKNVGWSLEIFSLLRVVLILPLFYFNFFIKNSYKVLCLYYQ